MAAHCDPFQFCRFLAAHCTQQSHRRRDNPPEGRGLGFGAPVGCAKGVESHVFACGYSSVWVWAGEAQGGQVRSHDRTKSGKRSDLCIVSAHTGILLVQ